MDRRSILKYAATLTGMSMLSPLSLQVLASVKEGAPKRVFFSQSDFELITSIMDTILPKTDTPSASDVNVNLIMDNMIHNVFDKNYQSAFMKRFNSLKAYLTQQNFMTLSAQKKLSLMQALEDKKRTSKELMYLAYIDIKQQTVSYYLSTEEIAENHLNYLPIPGPYIPNKSVKELNGKAWAE